MSDRDPFGRGAVVTAPRFMQAASALTIAGLALLVLADTVRQDVLAYLALGSGIGIATCIPIGIANVVVIDAAYRHGVARAVGAAVGGALADGVYASLGIFGIGPLLASSRALPYVLRAISGCVLIGYGLMLWRRPPPFTGAGGGSREAGGGHQLARGVGVGLGATLLNPSAVVTWVVIVGSHAAGVTSPQGGAWVAGIVLGTFGWFLVVTHVALRGARARRGTAWLTRVLAVLVIVSGAVSLGPIARLVLSP
jgi:arginine exporter protein ArgO